MARQTLFKETRVGKIPDEWNVVDLAELMEDGVRNGYSPTCPTAPTGRWVLSLGALSPQGLQPQEKKPAPAGDEKVSDFFLRPGDFLISRSNTRDRVGWSAMFRGEVEACAFPDLMMQFRVRAEEVVPEFMEAYLYSTFAVRHFQGLAAGTSGSMVKVNQAAVRELPVVLPPLPEQQKIASILASVDAAIAATRKVIEQTKRVKQGLLQTLMTRGIGHTRFRKTEIGEIPEGWRVVELREVTTRITDGTHQAVKTAESGSVPFLYVSSIRNGRIDMKSTAFVSESTYAEISPGREAFQGLVLYTAVGSYGQAAVVPDDRRLAFQRHIAYLAPDERAIIPGYLASFLNSPMGRREADRFAVGNAQKTITLRDLRRFRLLLPPVPEQQAMMTLLDEGQRQEEVGESVVDRLTALKQGLLQDLLTGRVRVPVD